jgi:hypothetical protein
MAAPPPVTAAPVAERLRAQGLSGEPQRSATAVAGRLLAVQAQNLGGARLAIRARSHGLTAADVDAALDRRELVVTWLNRGTLHLARTEDHPWLHALTAPRQLPRTHHRLAQEGVSPGQAERAAELIARALAEDGPLTRHALRDRLDAAGIPTGGQAMPHLLGLTALRGTTVRGPVVGPEQAHMLVRDWLGDAPSPPDRDRALAELGRRYLAGHGPADAGDLARWAGIALGEARRALEAIAGELEQRPGGLVDLAGREPAPPLPGPRLLGPFEPVLLGWASREAIVGPHRELVTVNGVFKPFLLVEGRAAGTWRQSRGEVTLEPFAPLDAPVEAGLRAEAADVRRFLGGG